MARLLVKRFGWSANVVGWIVHCSSLFPRKFLGQLPVIFPLVPTLSKFFEAFVDVAQRIRLLLFLFCLLLLSWGRVIPWLSFYFPTEFIKQPV